MATENPNVKTDLYVVLQVERTASQEEIKNAYRKLSMANHPDKNGDASMQAQINEAYEILSDPEKRKKYDETGETKDNSFEHRCMSLLNSILMTIVDNTKNVATVDLMGTYKQCVDVLVKLAKDKAEKQNNRLTVLNIIESKLSSKKDHSIIIIIRGNIDLIKKEILSIESDQAFYSKVLGILDDYEYKRDEELEVYGDLAAYIRRSKF